MILTSKQITEYILDRYEGLVPQNTWGETSFFYNPGLRLNRGTYFITIKEKNGENDKASDLDRDGVFRINFGLSKSAFLNKFGELPFRPKKGGVIDMDFDFTKFNTLMPHPVYGWIYWVCILNPSKESWVEITPLIDKYYETTKKRFEKRISKL